ncbi:MAG: transketolase, partial [Alphaproteobacteria bacterium]
SGAVAPEAMAAHAEVVEDIPGAGLLAVTSPDMLHKDWGSARTGEAHIKDLLDQLAPNAALVTVLDGAPATLSWLGSVNGQRVHPLGVSKFGQSGDIPDLYRTYGLDTAAIVDACAEACLAQLGA